MKKIAGFFCILFTGLLMMISSAAWAAHPLITDDTGTQGKGGFEIELNGEFEHDDDDGVESEGTTVAGTLSVGLADAIDLVFGIPVQFTREIEDTEEGHETTTEEGISDVSIEVKWRFWEREGLSFAVKPVVTLPTGDRKEGLGGGRMTASLYLISTLEKGPACFHANVGYVQNENKNDERKELWHASLAMEYGLMDKWTLVANIGADRNPDRESQTSPAWIIGGVIYRLSDHINLDMGIKGGLNDVAPDYAVLGGLALTF